MKKYKVILSALISLGCLVTSCDPSVESLGANDQSEITFLPKIILDGDAEVVLPCDATSYSDPGARAEAGGTEIELITTVTSSYFGGESVEDGPDVYSVAYSAFNEDDIPAKGTRKVIFPECNGDLISSIAGTYTASVARDGITPSSAYEDNGPFIIKDLGDDRYQISDAHGGWYEYGRGLGVTYAVTGIILKANNISTNSFTSEGTVTTGTFGGVNTFTSLTVNPVTKTLVLTVDWSFGFQFVSTWTQVEQ